MKHDQADVDARRRSGHCPRAEHFAEVLSFTRNEGGRCAGVEWGRMGVDEGEMIRKWFNSV